MGGFPQIWNLENIKSGIEQFTIEHGRTPTARDFDETAYLPSARQIQRAFGGLSALRATLGYTDLDFTRGDLRRPIVKAAYERGLQAEKYFEAVLVKRFGEPFVHTQKRYQDSKHRYDFFVYTASGMFGVDVFTTDRSNYIEKNLRHKVNRYKDIVGDFNIYFILIGTEYTPRDVEKAIASVQNLTNHPNLLPIHESQFNSVIEQYQPWPLPHSFAGLYKV